MAWTLQRGMRTLFTNRDQAAFAAGH